MILRRIEVTMKIYFLLLALMVFMFSCRSTPNESAEDIDELETGNYEQITDEAVEEQPAEEHLPEEIAEEPAVIEQLNDNQFICMCACAIEVTEAEEQQEPELAEVIEDIFDTEPAYVVQEEQVQPPEEEINLPVLPAILPMQQLVPPPPSQTPLIIPPALLGPAEERPPAREPVREPEQPPQQAVPQMPPLVQQRLPQDDASLHVRSGIVIPQGDDVVFSRTVRATVGQVIEIPFRGNGWVYLGELASRRGISYSSRRNDPEGQSFIFRADEAGTYVLKFFRQDFIRDYILNDHVQVIVGEPPVTEGAGWFNPPVDRGRVVAQPRWPSVIDEAAMLRGGAVRAAPDMPAQQAAPVPQIPAPPAGAAGTAAPAQQTPAPPASAPQPTAQTSQQGFPTQLTFAEQQALQAQTPQPAPETLAEPQFAERQPVESPEVLLQRAQETFNEGNVAVAIALLHQYMEYYPGGSDEIYWLLGQFYEANSPSRNILLSLDYYRRLMREYPQSRRFNDARRRVAFLERFYININ
jgi:hypothetical protein